jgi:hypothetical protein
MNGTLTRYLSGANLGHRDIIGAIKRMIQLMGSLLKKREIAPEVRATWQAVIVETGIWPA